MTDSTHDHADADQHGDQHGDEHHGSGRKFVYVFFALLVLTAMSFFFGSVQLHPPQLGWIIMITISCMKALLVMLFFMHLLWEANWKYVLTIPASIMSIFLLLMLMPDIMARTRHYSAERWLHAPRPEAEAEQEPEHEETDDEPPADH